MGLSLFDIRKAMQFCMAFVMLMLFLEENISSNNDTLMSGIGSSE